MMENRRNSPSIAHVCYFDPDTYPGVYNSSNLLVEQGWEVDVFCLEQYRFACHAFDPRVRLHFQKEYLSGAKLLGLRRFVSLLLNVMRVGCKRDWDFVFGHNMLGFVAARLSATVPASKVGYWCQDLSEYPAKFSVKLIVFYLKTRFLKKCPLIIAPSRMRAKALRENYSFSGAPRIVYNSPILHVQALDELWRVRLGIANNVPMIVYGGGLGDDRYIPELIQSVEFWHAPSVLVIAGYGKPGVVERLQEVARKSGVSERVFFVGHLSSLFGLIRESQIGVSMYSSTESIFNRKFTGIASNKIFEYLAMGKPAIVSYNEETATFMESFKCGACVMDQSPRGIAEVINSYLMDPVALEQASINARLTHERETYFEKRFLPVQRFLYECSSTIKKDKRDIL